MNILLTNDDGIQATGILAMWREIRSMGEVSVIAPETVQSATGHGITVSGPLLTSRVKIENGFEGIAVDGRPADCVKLAIDKLLPKTPELVISGVNHGANVGIAVIYSGTVAAAIEAAFLGLPAIAVSVHLEGDTPPDFPRAAKLAMKPIQHVLKTGLQPGQVANINIPALSADEEPKGIRVVRQCVRAWTDTYEERFSPREQRYFWNNTAYKLVETEDDTDVAGIRDKYITITPLQFDLTQYSLLKKWQSTGAFS